MANAPLRKCSRVGCTAYTRTGRCEKHAKEKATYDQHRPNSYQRGYDKRWSNEQGTGVRDQYVREHPLCEDCLEEGRTTAVEHVHHVKKVKTHPELRLDTTNLRSLCEMHHNRRTARGE